MNERTIFRAMCQARDRIERDIELRAHYEHKGRLGIAVEKDEYAVQFQKHERQYELFRGKLFARLERLRGALGNLLTHVEMIEAIQGFEFEVEEFPFNIRAAMKEAARTLGITLNSEVLS